MSDSSLDHLRRDRTDSACRILLTVCGPGSTPLDGHATVIGNANVVTVVIVVTIQRPVCCCYILGCDGAATKNVIASDDLNVTSVPREINHSLHWVGSKLFYGILCKYVLGTSRFHHGRNFWCAQYIPYVI